MKTNEITINMQQVPKGYIYCFNEGCTKREECLRWIVGSQLDDEVKVAPTVLPSVLKMRSCPYFSKAEPMRMAWGFNKLFEEVKSKHEAVLRDEMKEYLGGNGSYSRYKLGRKLRTPRQQSHILSMFHRKGYAEVLEFDHYVTTYQFDD